MMGAIGFVLRSFTEQEQKEVYYYYIALLDYFREVYHTLQKKLCVEICIKHSLERSVMSENSKAETIYWSVQPEQQLTHNLLQLDSTFLRGLQAVRMMLLEGFNKSAIFVNTPCPQPPEMLNRRKQSDLDSAEIRTEV